MHRTVLLRYTKAGWAAFGIVSDSHVVIVRQVNTSADRVNRTRVAWTLIYAGVSNVAILDGGYDKWVADQKAVSTELVRAKPEPYKGVLVPRKN